MTNLTHAHRELFRRTPDQIFPTLQALWEHCQAGKERSTDRWRPPQAIRPGPDGDRLVVDLGEGNEPFALNDWSFGQLCSIAKVSKETVNRVSADTASRVLQETLPTGNKPLQVFTGDDLIRSIHGHTYTRLHDAEVVTMLREFAVDFRPPQQGSGGGTGLYCGEQDLFAFLIDPTGWAEIDGQAFAPGFFVWIGQSCCLRLHGHRSSVRVMSFRSNERVIALSPSASGWSPRRGATPRLGGIAR